MTNVVRRQLGLFVICHCRGRGRAARQKDEDGNGKPCQKQRLDFQRRIPLAVERKCPAHQGDKCAGHEIRQVVIPEEARNQPAGKKDEQHPLNCLQSRFRRARGRKGKQADNQTRSQEETEPASSGDPRPQMNGEGQDRAAENAESAIRQFLAAFRVEVKFDHQGA